MRRCAEGRKTDERPTGVLSWFGLCVRMRDGIAEGSDKLPQGTASTEKALPQGLVTIAGC